MALSHAAAHALLHAPIGVSRRGSLCLALLAMLGPAIVLQGAGSLSLEVFMLVFLGCLELGVSLTCRRVPPPFLGLVLLQGPRP